MDLDAPAGGPEGTIGRLEGAEPKSHLVVGDGEVKYGIPLDAIEEVLRVPAELSRREALRFRGRDLRVEDLGGEPGPADPEGDGPPRLLVLRSDPPVALRIPHVVGVWDLREDEASSTVRFPVGGPVGRSLKGVIRVRGEMVFLLDVAAYVAAAAAGDEGSKGGDATSEVGP
ncbi:MAG: chemotaxis protein CheW [Planctomycetota bacterium]|jgi:chemotaxis signal transduction protein